MMFDTDLNNLNNDLTSLAHDRDTLNSNFTGNTVLKRKRSGSIVSQDEGDEQVNVLAPNKLSKVNIDNSVRGIVRSLKHQVRGNCLRGVYFNGVQLSSFRHKPSHMSASLFDHAPSLSRGSPTLTRPSFIKSVYAGQNTIRMTNMATEEGVPFLVRPTQLVKLRGNIRPLASSHILPSNDIKMKSKPLELAHFVHSKNVESHRENSSILQDKKINSVKDVSLLDAAFVLSSHFTRSNNRN